MTRRVRRERCGSGITTHCASNRTLPRSSSCGEAAVETSVDMPEERNSEALTEKKDGTSYDGSVINPHNHFSPSRTWPLSVSNNCASVCDGRISSTAWFSNCKSDPSSPHRDLLQDLRVNCIVDTTRHLVLALFAVALPLVNVDQ